MRSINTVLWDLDGTLIDSEHIHNMATARVCEVLAPELCTKLHQLQIPDGAENKVLHELLFTCSSIPYNQWDQAVVEYVVNNSREFKVIQQSVGLFKLFCKKGLQQFVVSNSDSRIIKHALDFLGLTSCCHDYFGRDMVEFGKPNPELYLLALDKYKLNPINCLVFEDSATGITAAQMAGLTVVAVATNNNESVSRFNKFQLDLVCDIHDTNWLPLLTKFFKFEGI